MLRTSTQKMRTSLCFFFDRLGAKKIDNVSWDYILATPVGPMRVKILDNSLRCSFLARKSAKIILRRLNVPLVNISSGIWEFARSNFEIGYIKKCIEDVHSYPITATDEGMVNEEIKEIKPQKAKSNDLDPNHKRKEVRRLKAHPRDGRSR